jgi:hypothetical protein
LQEKSTGVPAFEEVSADQVEAAEKAGVTLIRKNGKVFKHKRMRADARWMELMNFIEAIAGRAIADGGSAGLISYKGVDKYLKQYRPIPGILHGHLGAVAGMNTWKQVRVLTVAGWHYPGLEALISDAEAAYALHPDGERPDHNSEMLRVVRRLRVEGSEDGVPVVTYEPTCPLVKDVYVERVVGETAQAMGRDRGIWRGEENPVLSIDISNTVPDLTYDAVVDWNDIIGTTEVAAIVHSKAVLPGKPDDVRSLVPHHFTCASETREVMRDILERDKRQKRGSSPIEGGNPNTSIGGKPRFCQFVQPLTVQRALAGYISNQRLLTPATPESAVYRPLRQTLKPCLVDSSRRVAAEASLSAALNCGLAPAEAPKTKQAAHRPRSDTPSPATLRKREQRARKKAAAEAAAAERVAAARTPAKKPRKAASELKSRPGYEFGLFDYVPEPEQPRRARSR